MNLNFPTSFRLAIAGVLLAANLWAAEPDAVAPAVTRDDSARNYLQIQEQIHTLQLTVTQAQQSAASEAKSHADALAGRLQSLETSVAAQHATNLTAAHKTQQLTLFLAGAFGLAGLGIMLLMVYFQWRAFTQLAAMAAPPAPLIPNGNAVQHLAAPGRAAVEDANTKLLDVISQLEKRINELEGDQRLLPDISATKPADLPGEVQRLLDAGQPQAALDFLERLLMAQPQHADALVKKAVALEKLGRTDESLASCDRALAVDATLALAHLHKGGLLNRLRRYDEALQCYEDALRAQEKKPKVS